MEKIIIYVIFFGEGVDTRVGTTCFSGGMSEQSWVLRRLGVSHRLRTMPADGSCFYHALIFAFDLPLDARELRARVADRLTEEDAQLMSAIHDASLSVDEVRARVRAGKWADHVEAEVAVSRVLQGCALLIVDESVDSVCIQGDLSSPRVAAVVRRDQHYWGVEFFTGAQESTRRAPASLLRLLRGRTCAHVKQARAPTEVRVVRKRAEPSVLSDYPYVAAALVCAVVAFCCHHAWLVLSSKKV